MKKTASFQEILEEKMRTQPRATSQENPDTDPRHMAFLLGQMPVFRFANPRPLRLFPREKASPQTTRKVRPRGTAHALTAHQTKAAEWFLQKGETLLPDFTASELKTAFRRLALKLHPDVQGGSAEEFLNLRHQRASLEEIFKKEKTPLSPAA